MQKVVPTAYCTIHHVIIYIISRMPAEKLFSTVQGAAMAGVRRGEAEEMEEEYMQMD